MSFANPNALLLLLLLPLFIVIGWPRSSLRRFRGFLSLALRLILITLLVLALAGFQIPRQADRLGVVFLVDVSDSMSPRMQAEALDYVRRALAEIDTEKDQAAVVLFGANAVVEQPMATAFDLSQLGANPITLNTDLAEAIRLGLALFPPDTAKRIVILSDGVETVGDGEEAARLAQATDVRIDYVPFAREVLPGEVLVTEARMPARVNEGEIFDLVVGVQSEAATSAELRVLAGGQVLYSQPVNLSAGENRFSVGPLSLPDTGFVDFRVQVEPQGADAFFQNNELSAFTEVKGRPSVLIVTPDEREVDFLRPALQENGLLVDVVKPRSLPNSLAALSQYSSIMLVNTPATELTQDRMDLLQIYVRDLGGGLVAVGGPNAYGVGGYFQTPLEETLPVEMRIRDQRRVPSLTVLFVLDRSGSMEVGAGPQGVTLLELGKEAIIRSFEFLNDYDRAGVMSFDSSAGFVVELQEMGDQANRIKLENEVAALRPGGGTDIYGALVAASRILPGDPSALKHMILLSDGGSAPERSLALAKELYDQYGITLSVVATGQGYAPWIRDLSRAGQGNLHEVFDASTIPSIFAAETVLATRSYIIENEFSPIQTGRSPIIEGITTVPSLQGYIATTEKNTATVIFRTPEEDPLLASWQYGLGRAVAFTSDASARWGVNWVTWDDYARFWGQAVRWTITEGSDTNLEVRVEQRGEQAYLVVDARDDDGEFLNGLNLNAAVVTPGLESDSLDVRQIAPGRYEVPFTPDDEGAYFVRVAGATEDLSVAQTAGWVLSYSAEYTLRETDERFLRDLAGITGGVSIASNPAAVFEHNLTIQSADQSIWMTLLTLAVFLLVLDIAARRIVITRSDVQTARQAVTSRIGGNRGDLPSAPTGRMVGLMDAKRRASQPTGEGMTADIKSTATPQATGRRKNHDDKPNAAPSNLASRLLETKRRDDES